MKDLKWIELNWTDTVFYIIFGVLKFHIYEVGVLFANHILISPKFCCSTIVAFKLYYNT